MSILGTLLEVESSMEFGENKDRLRQCILLLERGYSQFVDIDELASKHGTLTEVPEI